MCSGTSSPAWFPLPAHADGCVRPLREHRERSRAAWIFTSATLTVGGGFDHIATRLGLDDPHTLVQPSLFNWPEQALCYLPEGLPDPAARASAPR
jgi:ATP-dependent DNA helicase DinG